MDGAWYRAAGLAYGYFASLCAVLIALLLLKRWRSERALWRRIAKSVPGVGCACVFRVMSEGGKRLAKGAELRVPMEGTMGSAAGCDVCIPYRKVHLRSAFFWMEEDGLHMAPLHRDGFLVDGVQAQPGDEAILRDGAELRLGDLRLRLRMQRDKLTAAEAAAGPYVTRKRRESAQRGKGNGLGAPGRTREARRKDRKAGRERSASQREAKRMDAAAADRRKVLSRAAGAEAALCALLTAAFQIPGMQLGLGGPGPAPAPTAQAFCTMVVAAGLFTTLVLPRFLPVDPPVMALTNFFCGTGIVILLTVSPMRGQRQMICYLGGLVFMVLMSLTVTRLRHTRLLSVLAITGGLTLLVLPLLYGEWINGAKNWVTLPLIGSFQPSELVKLCLILVLARYFSAHRTILQMMPAVFFAASCMLLLMLQRDLGTALIYYLTTLILFYAACGNVPMTVAGIGGGVFAAGLGYRLFSHVKVRVAMWRNPWSDPNGGGYQIIQALLAIGSGGLFGVGLGQGTPEKIPEFYNDFIFAVICEQLGQVFGVLLLLLHVLLILRGVALVCRARRSFDMLLACGVLASLGIQNFMIVAGVIKLIPLTGVTMPFLSYGGSSLISCMGMIGILHGTCFGARDALAADLFAAMPRREVKP